MGGLIGKLLGKGKKGGRTASSESVMHLPVDISDPDVVVTFSGPMESDVWPALFMANTVQREFSSSKHFVICPERDSRLFNMLHWRPEVLCYAEAPRVPGEFQEKNQGRSVLFYPYPKVIDSDRGLLSGIDCGVRIAPLDEDSTLINFKVRTESPYFPEKLQQMCDIIGLSFDSDWKPEVQSHAKRAAEQKMAPVTGRMMPYIVVSQQALAILERCRAEIPLKTVTLSGKNSDLSNLDRELKTAIVAGAKAVATDNDDLWGDACAFGVPVAGLDKDGVFMKWHGLEASRNQQEFVEAWVEILKKGW